MNHPFNDEKDYDEVKTERQTLDHVCWDITDELITVDDLL